MSFDPIIIRVVNPVEGKLRKTYCFVGNVPKNIEAELNKLAKKPGQNSAVLKKFYGSKWRERLGLEEIIEGKKGGAQQDESASRQGSSGVQTEAQQDEPNEPALQEGDEIIEQVQEELFDDAILNSIGEGLGLEESIGESIISTNELANIVIPEQNVELGGTINFIFDYMVYPMDKITDLRHKISMVTHIPFAYQHVWFESDNRTYPALYRVMLHNHHEYIDARNLFPKEGGYEAKVERTEAEDDRTKAEVSDIELDIDGDNIVDQTIPLNQTIPVNKSIKGGRKAKKEADLFIDLNAEDTHIAGVPIQLKYYNHKDYLQIIAEDDFQLVSTINERYGINEYYVIDIRDLIEFSELNGKIGKDTQQFEMFYYGFVAIYFPAITVQVFRDLIKNDKGLHISYPDLFPSQGELKERYQLQGEITDNAYEFADDKNIKDKLFSSITSTILSINNFNQDVQMLLSLRNLFDLLELDDHITYARAYLLHDGVPVTLNKSYMGDRGPKETSPLNSLTIKIKTSPDANENMRLVIFRNGNYNVRTDWREENHMTFGKIIRETAERINPIIKKINSYGQRIKYYNIDLVPIEKHNVTFTETALSFYYDDDVTEARFMIFKKILEDYRKARIIYPKDSVTAGYEYFFQRGMYVYDATRLEKTIAITNYYDYLSNGIVKTKYETIFTKTRLFTILNISSKLKITVSGIRDNIEIENFHSLLMGLLYIYDQNAQKIKIVSDETINAKSKKALKNLKLQDPLLYDFKKIYKSNIVYSKICQKPYQPLILSDAEYAKLPKERRARSVKYFNFTKQKPVWYSCPNSKYPYIKFIVKQHPKDFCIPCCKKIEMNENVNVKKQEIHNTCLKEHVYTGEKVNLTKGSHYIASYGKFIEPGRLSRLPEHTLEPLFFDTYSPEGTIDQECVTTDGYYLLGIDQHLPGVKDIGMVFMLALALEMPVNDFLHDCSSRLNKNPDKFRVLLNGNIMLFFEFKELVSTIKQLASCDYVLPSKLEHLDWNGLFMSLAYYYYNINPIHFIDSAKEMIELILPRGLKNQSEMFPNTHRSLVFLEYKKKFYPIFLFNTEIYKRTGTIDTKLFPNESGLLTIIRAVVRRHFEIISGNKMKNAIDLAAIKALAASRNMSILAYYINYSNGCYGVALQYKKHKLYISIKVSHYSVDKGVELIFTPYDGRYDVDYDIYMAFLKEYASWNDEISRAEGLEGINMYPDIKPSQLLKQGDKFIGFIHDNINYFVTPTKTAPDNLPIQKIMYHPYQINSVIAAVKSGKNGHIGMDPPNELRLNQSLYDYYAYQLLLFHLISYFNSERNLKVRGTILRTIAKTNFNKTLEPIKKLLETIEDPEDVNKLRNIFSRFISQHHDEKRMIQDIQNSYFEFDKVSLMALKGIKKEQILTKIRAICKTFVTISDIRKNRAFTFPNMFSLCSANGKSKNNDKSNSNYCLGGKLALDQKTFDIIIDILASDMVNPEKWKWLFNAAFIEKSVDYFKFIRRKNETITVTIEQSAKK